MAKRNSRLYQSLSACKAFWILAALALWLIALMDDLHFQFAGMFLMALFLMVRFKRKEPFFKITLWLIICLLFLGSRYIQQPQEAMPGEYTIINIRNGYAIAKHHNQKAVVYEKEDLALGDRIEIEQFEAVHTLNNQPLFCFSDYLHDQGIEASAVKFEKVESRKESWKGKVWVWIHDHDSSGLFNLLFYGLNDQDQLEWLNELGLPLMALCMALRTVLSRFFYPEHLGWIISGFLVMIMLSFPVTTSMIRLFVFSLAGNLFKTWEERWPASVCFFLWVYPFAAGSLCLVLPAGLSFLTHFEKKDSRKKVINILWCAVCQILWMNHLNVLFCGTFLFIRKIYGWFFLLCLPGLVVENYAMKIYELLGSLEWSLDFLTIQGYPPFWYSMILASLIVLLVCKWSPWRASLMVLSVCLYSQVGLLDPFFHVWQMDVGQGDCAIIVEPFQKSVTMIDAAGTFNKDNATELIIPMLEALQIREVDQIIVTHSDFDHSGAVQSLCEHFPVRHVIVNEAQKGDIETGYDLQLMLEERNVPAEDEEDPNDSSIICAFGYDGFGYLWTGDASSAIEKQLIKAYSLPVDVLKLGHHGSSTSSCSEFLQETSPQLALISAGYQNRYGHPSLETLKRLNTLGIDRINTANHGSIHMMSFHSFMIVQTADGLLTLIRPK